MLFDGPDDPAPPPAPRANATPDPKLLDVHDRLCRAYDCPIPYFHDLDPLSELVSSLLSHRTKNADSGRAFKALRAAFPSATSAAAADWAAVRDADVTTVQELIAPVTWPEQKAPRIQAVLRDVAARRGGRLSLDFLRDLTPRDARAWLEQLPGVGPKTSAAVLSFSTLRMRALPVDSHHHRVAVRLGVIPAKLAVGDSHAVLEAMLPPDWTPQQVYDHHEVLMLHGQRCCFHTSPACHRCPVLDLCPTGQSRTANPPRADTTRPPDQRDQPHPTSTRPATPPAHKNAPR